MNMTNLQVEFSKSKTREEAIEDTTSGKVYFTSDSNDIVFRGKAYGNKDIDNSYTTSASDTKGHWTVNIPGVTELYDGLKIHIRLGTAYYANGENYNTLNVNGLGAKMVWYRYNSRFTSHLTTNAEITLTYRTSAGSYKVTTSTGELTKDTTYTDGWVCDYAYDNNDTQTSSLYNTRPYVAGEGPLYPYKLCAITENFRILPLVKTDGTGTSKTQTTYSFRPEKIYYNNYWSTIQQNAQCYNELKSSCSFNAPRNFNTTVPANHIIFLKGKYNDGLFTLDQTSTTSWYVFVPMNTTYSASQGYFSSGSYYIKIGCSGASVNTCNLEEVNTLYYYDGTRLAQQTYRAVNATHAHFLYNNPQIVIGNTAKKFNGHDNYSWSLDDIGVLAKDACFQKFTGTYNADECLTPGVYQYITLGRSGLDTVTDSQYSLLVMQTGENTIRQIAFGSKKASNVYSRVCVNSSWSDSDSVYTFQKITSQEKTINLRDSSSIANALAEVDVNGEFIGTITDENGNTETSMSGDITAVSEFSNKIASDSAAIAPICHWLSNKQLYYSYLNTWSSITFDLANALPMAYYKIGDKIKIYKHTVSIEHYLNTLNLTAINTYISSLSTAQKAAYTAYKTLKGKSSLSDIEFIKYLITSGTIYGAPSNPNNGGTTSNLSGSTVINVYDYSIIQESESYTLLPKNLPPVISYTVVSDTSNSVNSFVTSAYASPTASESPTANYAREFYAGYSSVEYSSFFSELTPISTSGYNSLHGSGLCEVPGIFREGRPNDNEVPSNKWISRAMVDVIAYYKTDYGIQSSKILSSGHLQNLYSVNENVTSLVAANQILTQGYSSTFLQFKVPNSGFNYITIRAHGDFKIRGSWCVLGTVTYWSLQPLCGSLV